MHGGDLLRKVKNDAATDLHITTLTYVDIIISDNKCVYMDKMQLMKGTDDTFLLKDTIKSPILIYKT